jgi:membrane-associated phospholipid phosphatase
LKNSIRGKTTGNFLKQRRTLWIWLIVILLGIGLTIAAFHFDSAVQAWQHQHRIKNIKVLSRNVTRGTDWPSHVIAGLLLAAIAWWRGNKKWTRIFLAMVIAGGLAGGTAYALKLTTGRVRPSVKATEVWGGPNLRQNFQSFPSGHTAVTTGFFGVLFLASWRIGLLCLPIPLFVALSRIFLGAHYLSDVVTSIVIGALCALLVAQLWLCRFDESRDSPEQRVL